MGLSRLDNFLKSVRGTILYVNPNDLDSTDSIENKGNSLTRPFRTIQRALIEAARFSYQRGLNNDRFGKTTILIYPGDHLVDNRPGWIPDGSNNFRLRNGTTSNNISPFDLTSNFDLSVADNELYKLNSINGGVIIPRGTSLVGLDLRKTKIRPKYVPDPTNDNIERSCIFRVTGGCYFWQFSMFDSDPTGQCYLDYTDNLFVPNFSHHKLSCFEYADGVNGVNINDEFMTYSTSRTDLDMYYEKVGLVYGQSSGRAIEPDYPSSELDIQPKVDEYRIVGSTGQSVGISSIIAGDGTTTSTNITVTTSDSVPGLDVDTPFRIEGVTASGYNGQYVVSEKLSDTQIVYQVQNPPSNPFPSATGSTLSLTSDTVTSASPYIFNVSLRSVYGMCGVLADGDKASGFKSMVIAQFTGIGLQKDDNAFVIYNSESGSYDDNTVPGNETLSNNSRSVFKPSYKNFHIKAINDAFIQNVSIFAIGYAEHFVVESGGDMSITNSNSNFGAKSLVASGFRRNAFSQDDVGYITHIIPPKELPGIENAIEFDSIDVLKTSSATGIGSTSHLYLYNETNFDVPPENVIEGYRIGAKTNDTLNVLVSYAGSVTEYSSKIVMQNSQNSSEKISFVNRSVLGINSITNNIISLTTPHEFLNGESVRLISNTGQIPDGLTPNTLYYVITDDNVSSGLTTSTDIKLAKTQNDAISANELTINNKGGILKIVSRVSDKVSGDIGHPIQYDVNENQWYVRVSAASTENTIFNVIENLKTSGLGNATSRTYIKRQQDGRSSLDTLYRVRYVIPSNAGGVVARPPSDGFIIQESNTSIGSTTAEIQSYFGTGSITNVNQQRNFRFIANATWDGTNAFFDTELPHNLSIGSQVEIVNVTSTNNSAGDPNSGFNRTFVIEGVPNSKIFYAGLSTNPGTFTSDTTVRDTNLPYFKRKKFNNTYYIFRSQEAQKYIAGEQDGIYYLTLINSSNSPTVSPFTGEKYSQPVKELFPQINRDNPVSDPQEAKSFASSSLIGEVYVDDVRKSITKETLTKVLVDTNLGVGITNILSANTGTAHTIQTSIDHGLNRIVAVSIANSGAGYGSGSAGFLYNASLVGASGSITGSNATAKITVNTSGNITDVKIMDGGSAYGIGNTLTITGVSTFAGYSEAYVTVTKIYDNAGDVVRISGVTSESYGEYNDLYRITSIPVGRPKDIEVQSARTLGVPTIAGSATTTLGVGESDTLESFVYLTGQSVKINNISYTNTTGIATITSANRHGFRVGNKVRFAGANQSVYNGDFVVTEVLSTTSFLVRVGTSTNSPVATGTIYAYRNGVNSNDGVITVENESLNGRMIPTYAGITTTLSALIPDPLIDEINIQNIENLDINIGDYLAINDEIVRVKTTTSTSSVTTPSNPIYVFRGVLGSKATNHAINSVVRRIYVNPIELRRHSISRASGHTFEYVGFGPGNYSTAFPDKQDRQLSAAEEILSQSTRKDGGINFYTGMNDKGISYAGNKKLSTVTGQEEIFDTPVQTVIGEDIGNSAGINIVNPLEGNFDRLIRVTGGNDGKATSEFGGPVIFNNKITSTSPKGIEANSLFIQGDSIVSRKYTVGIDTPTLAGNPGDVTYYDNPSSGQYVGWIYTLENDWRRFGNVSLSKDLNINTFDAIGIATTNPTYNKLLVGSGTTEVSIDGTGGVGIGTSANGLKLRVHGNMNVHGGLTASYFVGDGSALTNLNVNDTGWTNINTGSSDITYNTYLDLVGIGTSVSRYTLEVGSIGSATTSLYVNGNTYLNGTITANNANVTGIITASGFDLDSNTGQITAGIITSTNLSVGSDGLSLTISSGSVGFGTISPRTDVDICRHTRFKTYSEDVQHVSPSSGVVTIDLSSAQTFLLNVNGTVSSFRIINVPSGSTSFTIRTKQNSIGGYSVDIDTFRNSGGTSIPVYWPGGGVEPIVTTTANASDVYSFKIFDGDNLETDGMYGVVGGQNFA
jgi:hypothetical protein